MLTAYGRRQYSKKSQRRLKFETENSAGTKKKELVWCREKLMGSVFEWIELETMAKHLMQIPSRVYNVCSLCPRRVRGILVGKR